MKSPEAGSGPGDALKTVQRGTQRMDSANKAYGCLFCATGKELAVARRVQLADPLVRAVVARQEKHTTSQGVKSKKTEIFLPGYVFFETERTMESLEWLPRTDVIRILSYGDGYWQMIGEDERFAKWLFGYDGLLGFSKAYREGEQVRIVSGPLKDMEGCITKVDKRGRSGQIAVRFDSRVIKVWLGFDMIDA